MDGPSMKPRFEPDITRPMTRPRSAAPYRSATSANPTPQVIASAAPCISRAANSHGRLRAKANAKVDAARMAMPATSGRRRPTRSDNAPTGTDTASSVTPNEANRNPTMVGDAPS